MKYVKSLNNGINITEGSWLVNKSFTGRPYHGRFVDQSYYIEDLLCHP